MRQINPTDHLSLSVSVSVSVSLSLSLSGESKSKLVIVNSPWVVPVVVTYSVGCVIVRSIVRYFVTVHWSTHLTGILCSFQEAKWREIIMNLKSFVHHLIKNRCLTHSYTMTPFDALGKQAFWKHCGEKEKLLVTSNFSFTHSVFYPFRELSDIFIKFKIVVCRPFQFRLV